MGTETNFAPGSSSKPDRPDLFRVGSQAVYKHICHSTHLNNPFWEYNLTQDSDLQEIKSEPSGDAVTKLSTHGRSLDFVLRGAKLQPIEA